MSTAYFHERCSQQNLRMRDGINNIYSLEMVYTAFNLQRWNTQHILMEDGVHSIPFSPGWGWLRNRSLIFVSPSSSSLRSPQHWLSRYGIHNIFSWEMEYTVYTHERWLDQQFVMTDAVQIVYSQEMGSTAFINDIWSTHYLLLKKDSTAFSHDICCCCSPPFPCSPYTAFTHERWSPQYVLKRDDVHNNYTWEM